MFGQTPQRSGARDKLTAPANRFAAADADVYIHAGTDALFPRLCEAMGRPELATDRRFRDVPLRMANVDAIEAEVRSWASQMPYDALATQLEGAGIPFGKIATVEEVVESEQIRARQMLVDVEHPKLGRLTLPGVPIKLSESPGSIHKAPPLVGEDNESVYSELLGIDSGELSSLREQGVI